jgi:UDP-N-acetylglucosamine 2-epimerase (non-hydrolysing)
VVLTEPLGYDVSVHLLASAYAVLTDSGGLQEEAPALGKPVLVLRSDTERPEGVLAGVAKVVGTDPGRIVAEAERLLDDPGAYQAMARAVHPYGDGRAAARIVETLLALAGP